MRAEGIEVVERVLGVDAGERRGGGIEGRQLSVDADQGPVADLEMEIGGAEVDDALERLDEVEGRGAGMVFVHTTSARPLRPAGTAGNTAESSRGTTDPALERRRPGKAGGMTDADPGWEERLAAAWAAMDDEDEASFRARIEELAAELPSGSAVAAFERGAAFDSTGHPDRAVPLYREALATGLTGERRRRAVIQMASSIRNLGDPEEAVRLLRAELEHGHDALEGAVRAFLALALVDVGGEREAASVALSALAEYLPRYNRSLARYAEDLLPGADPTSV